MATYFVFVDGVGIGRKDPAVNPFARGSTLLSHFDDGSSAPLPANGAAGSADATLGVPGRPQSATGQTTLLTGVNASKHLGKHLLGFPNAPLRKLLAERSLYLDLKAAGRSAAFANPFPAVYLDVLGLPHRPSSLPQPVLPERARRLRPSATTAAAAAAGVPLRLLDDLADGLAVTHDIVAERAHAFMEIAPVAPEEAARALLRIGRDHDFVLHEHFLLDQAGHARDFELAEKALGDLDRYLRAVAEGLRPEDHLLVTSDHGNAEDLSSRSHTRNPVPVLAFGARAAWLAGRVRSLMDVTPALLELCGCAAAPFREAI